MKPELSDTEQGIQAYLAELDRFHASPNVARTVVNINRNLLFRSKVFSDQVINEILSNVERIGSQHSDNAEVQTASSSSVAVALAAVAPQRPLEALVLFDNLVRLSALTGKPSPEDQLTLANSVSNLADALLKDYPAMAFAT